MSNNLKNKKLINNLNIMQNPSTMNELTTLINNPLFRMSNNNSQTFKQLQENVLKKKYLKEKQNLEDAPKRVADAEKNYYTFEHGEQWYDDFKENQAEQTAKKVTNKMVKEFSQDKKQLDDILNEYKTLLTYENKIEELSNYYDTQIEKITKENNKLKGTDNVNKRMSVYYERNIEKNDKYESIIKILYWVLIVVFVLYVLVLKGKYNNKAYWIILLVFIAYPYMIKYIIKMFDFVTFTKVKIQPKKKNNA